MERRKIVSARYLLRRCITGRPGEYMRLKGILGCRRGLLRAFQWR
jgi:hypothetical protein